MSQNVAIALVILVETILVFAGVTVFLIVRLRRLGTAAAASGGNAGDEAVREYLERQVAETAAWPSDGDPPEDAAARARQSAIEAELRALDTEDADKRRTLLAGAYAPSDAQADLAEDNERLKRLLQRENSQVRDLFELKDRFQELWLRYERVRRLLEQLDAADTPEAAAGALQAFRKAESAWADAMDGFGRRLEAVTGTAATDAVGAEEPGGSASARGLIERQTDAVAALRDELADSRSESALAMVDGLEAQLKEFEMCVQVLENENRYLGEQVRQQALPTERAEGDRPSDAELTQVLAMKDQQIAELREKLGLPAES